MKLFKKLKMYIFKKEKFKRFRDQVIIRVRLIKYI